MKHEPVTVRRLPPELISYIFSIGRDDNASIAYLRTISSVCSFWRNIAISTPDLWSTITYNPSRDILLFPRRKRDTIESNARRICERLEIFLARSCAAPIYVNITILLQNPKQTRRIRDIIIPHLWRCHSFTIWYDDPIVRTAFFPLPGRLGRLKKLKLHLPRPDLGPTTMFTKDAAPPLRSLTLGPTSLPLSMDFVPANTLTHLHLPVPEYNATIILFLRQCNMVETLELAVWPASGLLPGNFIPISMPSLRCLYVPGTLALEFQAFLFTPNVVELYLYGCADPYPETPNLAPTMLRMETATWYSLELEYLQHHMMSFSSVKNLVLSECNGVSNLLRYLAGFPDESEDELLTDIPETIEYPESQGCHILPRLEYLKIGNYFTAANRNLPRQFDSVDVAQWLKVLLECKLSLRVAVSPNLVDDVTAFEAQFGPRFAVVEHAECDPLWYESFQLSRLIPDVYTLLFFCSYA